MRPPVSLNWTGIPLKLTITWGLQLPTVQQEIGVPHAQTTGQLARQTR